MLPIKLQLNLTYGLGGDVVGVFQDGSQLGYRNRKILAILNFHNTPMPSIKFQLNFTYCLKDAGSKNFSHGSHLGYQNRPGKTDLFFQIIGKVW